MKLTLLNCHPNFYCKFYTDESTCYLRSVAMFEFAGANILNDGGWNYFHAPDYKTVLIFREFSQ